MSANFIAPPNVGSLITELKELSDDWFSFGALLRVPNEELEKIQHENSKVDHCKLAMFVQWLKRGINTTWLHVIEALKVLERRALADAISNKYSSVIDLSPNMSSTDMIKVKKPVVEKITKASIQKEFALLVVNAQNALDTSGQEVLRNVLTYLRNRLSSSIVNELPTFSHSPNACEVLITVLSKHWSFLKIFPLNEIISNFLKEDAALIKNLKNYNSILETYKSSTKMRELIHIIKTNKKAKPVSITLKLGRIWEDVTLEQFENLIKMLFEDEGEELHEFEVTFTADCICVTCYINDENETVKNLLTRASSISSMTLRQCQVSYLQIGDVTFWGENSSGAVSVQNEKFSQQNCQNFSSTEQNSGPMDSENGT
jgi:hypothetical protein